MKRRVYLSSTAKRKLADLLEYLQNNWSMKVKNEFIEKLDKKLNQISEYPLSGPVSKELPGLFKCVVTKHNTLYYRINNVDIEVVTFFDTR